MTPVGVAYSEAPHLDSILSCLWECAMCISKFLWTTQIYPSPCPGLIVYTERLGCCSSTTYLVIPSDHLSYVDLKIPSVLLDRGPQVQAWRISFSCHIITYGG